MKSSEREQDGKSSGVLLGPDVVLKVDSRISTGSYAAVAGPVSEYSNGQSLVEGQVVLSTVRAFERRLLALVDGQRSVKELTQLSGMSEAQAKRHLASLCRRRVLIPVDAPVIAAPSVPAVTDAGDSRRTPSWKAKGMAALAELDKTVVGVRAADLEATKMGTGAGDGPRPWDPKPQTPGAPRTRLPTDDADTEKVVLSRLQGGQPPRPTPTDKAKPGTIPTFKPNVTAFWIPSPVDEAAAALSPPPRSERALSPAQGTIVVTGPNLGSGPHQIPAWTPTPASSSGPTPAPGAGSDKGASAPFRLGGYEIATRLAQAGGASIYVCRQAGGAPLSRLFTLKVVRQRSSQAAEVIQAFRREGRVGALLNHPNLQTVVDVGSYHEQPFLILDYVENVSLAEMMGGPNRLPVAVVVSILLDVLQGLKSAHEVVDEQGMRLGLVHADVTPENILVGIDGKARLGDFGSARFGSDGRAVDIAPLPTGKPGFLTPEQLCDAPLDGRTDLFSLGVVMWTALTGQSLFVAETHDQTVANIFRKRIPPPSEFGAPACLDEILVRALSRSPEGRYASAAEMAEALARAATNQGIAGSAVEVGRWVKREFAEMLAAKQARIQAVFGGAATGGSVATPPQTPAPPFSPPPAPALAPVAPPPPQPAGEQALIDTQPAPLKRRVPQRNPPRRQHPARTEMTDQEKPAANVNWRVVLVAGLIAFPFTLALTYFVSAPLMRRMYPPVPEHPPAVSGGQTARPTTQAIPNAPRVGQPPPTPLPFGEPPQVDVPKGEAAKGEAVKGEAVKDEAVKDEAIKIAPR